MESTNFKDFVDAIRTAAKDYANPRAIKFANFIEDLYTAYQRFYPKEELLYGLKVISSDKAFIEPRGLKKDDPSQTIEEAQNRLRLVFWNSIILERFELFASIKSFCVTITKYAPPENNENNAIQEYVHFLAPLLQYVKGNIENYKSLTINSTNQNIGNHIVVPNIKYLINKLDADIKNFEKILDKLPGNDEEKIKLVEFISSFDIKEYQKHIFNGILDDFEIRKKGRTGKQSIRYKCELLWNLFKHTHPKEYREKGTAGVDVRSLRTNILLSIISPDSDLPISL